MSEKELFEIGRLANKYKDIGLSIIIEFDKEEMIFRGTWIGDGFFDGLEPNKMNRIYPYELMKNTYMDLEMLIDDFKQQFEIERRNSILEERELGGIGEWDLVKAGGYYDLVRR